MTKPASWCFVPEETNDSQVVIRDANPPADDQTTLAEDIRSAIGVLVNFGELDDPNRKLFFYDHLGNKVQVVVVDVDGMKGILYTRVSHG